MNGWQWAALLVGMWVGPALGRWIDRAVDWVWPKGGGRDADVAEGS